MQGITEFQGCVKECSHRLDILENTTAQHLTCNIYIVIIGVEGLLSERPEGVDVGDILHWNLAMSVYSQCLESV